MVPVEIERVKLREKIQDSLIKAAHDYKAPDDLDSPITLLQEFSSLQFTLLARLSSKERAVFEKYLGTFKLREACEIFNRGGFERLKEKKIMQVLGTEALGEMRMLLTLLSEKSDESADDDAREAARRIAAGA